MVSRWFVRAGGYDWKILEYDFPCISRELSWTSSLSTNYVGSTSTMRFVEVSATYLWLINYVFLSSLSTTHKCPFKQHSGSEEGPLADHIPFDGRDVWRFVLIADDSMRNIWHADPNSFVNLGRNQRNRCWPWSEGNELPFKRPKNDMPLKGHGPQGSLPIHVCKGPFGCNGCNHPHSFQAYAA